MRTTIATTGTGTSYIARTIGTTVPLALCFTVSMLLSALLLFLIQPMFAKMALPLLGGSPGVWNTAMVFFQGTLLLGYLYAHLLTRHVSFRNQILLHGIFMSSALFFLPIALPDGWTVPQSDTPSLWLMGLFGTALGLPFFALSANAPLLQKWLSYTNHKSADDPYFLYAASNAGSLFSLLCYPLAVEPFLKLAEQSFYWTLAFMILISLIILCGLAAEMNRKAVVEGTKDDASTLNDLPMMRRLKLVGIALIPSSLMLGVTSHITANVASAPFLWVLPLALYLLTFIFAFSARPLLPNKLIEIAYPAVLVIAILLATIPLQAFELEVLANLTCFFLIAQMCHNKLAQDRPQAEHLTGFYLSMSLGGVVGGAITALAAPLLFTGTHEYALMLAVAALIAKGNYPGKEAWVLEAIIAAFVISAVMAIFELDYLLASKSKQLACMAIATLAICAIVLSRKRPFRLASAMLVLALLSIHLPKFAKSSTHEYIFSGRSFFGVSTVHRDLSADGVTHSYVNGNTIHNIQLRKEGVRTLPLAYYHSGGAFGQAIEAVRNKNGPLNVAAVGLGAGTLACHIRSNENWKFYEIDPVVVEMARNPELFSFITDCAPQVPIEIGDARLTLKNVEKDKLDLVIIDAFSSNSIPAHLATLEAFQLYNSLLNDNGYIFFHTSNHSLDVSSVVINIAESLGLATRHIDSHIKGTEKYNSLLKPTEAVLVGKDAENLDELLADYPEWKERKGAEVVGLWTDDFSHIIGALIARQQQQQLTR